MISQIKHFVKGKPGNSVLEKYLRKKCKKIRNIPRCSLFVFVVKHKYIKATKNKKNCVNQFLSEKDFFGKAPSGSHIIGLSGQKKKIPTDLKRGQSN